MPDYSSAYADSPFKMSIPKHRGHMSIALSFPIDKRVTDHCSILVPEAVGFSQELLPPRT